MAIIIDDPDAPGSTFDHWVVFNLPAKLREMPEGQPGSASLLGGIQGKNDFGTLGYRAPCPPSGPAHTYRIALYAVDQSLPLAAAALKDQVLAALEGSWGRVYSPGPTRMPPVTTTVVWTTKRISPAGFSKIG